MSEFAIPMGFRFDPTDEELIKYLCLQVNGDPLPWNGVVYKNLYGPDAAPWMVFSGDFHCYWHTKTEGGPTKSTTFVFTKLIRFPNSRRISRTSGGGTWSGQTSPKKIFNSVTGETIGHMRMLSFKPPDSSKASLDFRHWIMHEYSLIGGGAAADLVVCKITMCVKNGGRSRPQPQLVSSVIADGGRSECKHIQTNKRAAEEECYAQECKARKLCGDDIAAEMPPPHLFSPRTAHVQEVSCKEEKPGDGGSFSDAAAIREDAGDVGDSWLVDALGGGGDDTAAEAAIREDAGDVDDSWLVDALGGGGDDTAAEAAIREDAGDVDDSWLVDALGGGGDDTAAEAAIREDAGEVDDSRLIDALGGGGGGGEEEKHESWRASLHQNLDNIVKSCGSSPQAEAEQLQFSAQSPFAYNFSFDDSESSFVDDEILDLEPLWSSLGDELT